MQNAPAPERVCLTVVSGIGKFYSKVSLRFEQFYHLPTSFGHEESDIKIGVKTTAA